MSIDKPNLGEIKFRLVLRGYQPAPVEAALRRAEQAAIADDPAIRAAAAKDLRATEFPVVLRGYDRYEVDAYIALLIGERLLASEQDRAAQATTEAAFTRSLRGYDPEHLDPLLQQAGQALVSGEPAQLAAARAAIQAGDLPVRWFYGYDREQVDHFLADLDRRLAAAGQSGQLD